MKFNRKVLSNFRCGRLKKYSLIMRLTWFLILILTLPTSASVWSQTMSVKLKNSTLQELFTQIEKNSSYRFFYNNDDVDVNQRTSVEAKEQSVGTILGTAFKGMPYSFKELENKLILIEKIDAQSSSTLLNSQQQKSISGKVTDSSGASLPGVSVVVKGTTTGIITDINGNYSLPNIPENATLQFSFVGMKTQEVKPGSKSLVNVALEDETIGIEEVVAIGYGVQKKESVTGSIAGVTSKDLERVHSATVSSALAGKLAGVSFRMPDGRPGASANIQIRNMGAPLYVIDGIQKDAGQFNNISPNDIESLSILKDASAAIYGVRAANGVVVVTTKRGKLGTKNTINVDA
jgi:TonB-dependent SusC/RagA subfamily outer membrane receptor